MSTYNKKPIINLSIVEMNQLRTRLDIKIYRHVILYSVKIPRIQYC
jgi:hypothetical protein